MRQRLTGLFVSACLAAGLLVSGCDYLPSNSDEEEQTNTPPAVVGIYASAKMLPVRTDTTLALDCVAMDNQDNASVLTYAWVVAAGTTTGSGRQINWTTPATTQNVKVTCSVTDTQGLSSTSSTTIEVKKR